MGHPGGCLILLLHIRIQSFARAAQEYSFVKPFMTYKNEILVTEGRHPLSERCVESFVSTAARSPARLVTLTALTGPK